MTHPFAHGTPTAVSTDDFPLTQPTVGELITRQVRLRPEAIALESNEKTLTYLALDERANHLAQQLKANGVQANDVVPVCLKRTENLVIGLLGVMKAGAAYLPLNPEDPPFRLGHIIAHAAARITVTDDNSKAHLPEASQQLLLLEPQTATEPERKTTRLDPPRPEDLAYVIYTSGTTGAPKGVAVPHVALSNVVADVAERVAFDENSSWLAVTTISFDIAALEIFLPLCFGGRVILASEDQARIGRVLAGMIHRKKPTVMQATPITWRILIESGWAGSPDLTILCGGDSLDRELANKLVGRCSAMWNMYGPSETTIWSTADKLALGEDVVTLGRPLANTTVYILDNESKPLPDGEIGEICIGGAGLARGYLNNPQLTERCFIHAPLGPLGGTRLYRTGDLGRWNGEGKLEFFGRIDHQVKIDGFRVELPEIERALQKYPGISEAAVLGVGGANHQKRLYAFVVAQAGVQITAAGLTAHLALLLPKYMIPVKFWLLERLPSTPHGKRDVVALGTHAQEQPELVS